MSADTIVAISTAPGRSGIGVVRLTGPASATILARIAGGVPRPRMASFRPFRHPDGAVIDEGIALYFPGPASFTGEDVAEFHAHGSVAVLGALLEASRACGARDARPGEFTERAFLNGKLDLAQAEAVADLIDARSTRAARAAVRTLRGEFSRAVNALVTTLRATYAELEASIDFPDDLDGAAAARWRAALEQVRSALHALLARGEQGARLNAGASIAIVGAPNAGKSTLMNVLLGEDSAIVSPQPGTTRDVVVRDLVLDGVPVRLHDTAGLRDGGDAVEREGMRRALEVTSHADLVLFLSAPDTVVGADVPDVAGADRVLSVENKIDLSGAPAGLSAEGADVVVRVSARTGAGLDALRAELTRRLGAEPAEENEFLARDRHLAALAAALVALDDVDEALLSRAPELAAECCRGASRALEAITGEYGTEDLLGDIFARFCIGK